MTLNLTSIYDFKVTSVRSNFLNLKHTYPDSCKQSLLIAHICNQFLQILRYDKIYLQSGSLWNVFGPSHGNCRFKTVNGFD